MTDWTPPLETGLNGNRSPEEDLEAFADTIDEMHRPGVYIVKCSTPDDWRVALDCYDQHFDADPPEWLRAAFDAHVCLYTGAAKDVLSRLHQHLDSANQSTALARVYPFHSLWGVEWFDTADKAFDREHGIALSLDADLPGAYVHVR